MNLYYVELVTDSNDPEIAYYWADNDKHLFILMQANGDVAIDYGIEQPGDLCRRYNIDPDHGRPFGFEIAVHTVGPIGTVTEVVRDESDHGNPKPGRADHGSHEYSGGGRIWSTFEQAVLAVIAERRQIGTNLRFPLVKAADRVLGAPYGASE